MISLILPTLGTREEELIRLMKSLENQTFKDFEVIMVSQDHHEQVESMLSSVTFHYQHIRISKKGLSHARNIGMGYAKGEIITFSDDDCWYEPNAFEEVSNHFKNTNVDIACFQIYDPEVKEFYKNYPTQPQNQLTLRDIFRKSSIEIFINIRNMDRSQIKFDEQFGLGAKYPSGEENIFLYSMYRHQYKIGYVPKVVVNHRKPSIESRLNLSAFRSKGPLFKRMFNTPVGLVMLTLLFLKKFPKLESPFKFYCSSVKELYLYKKND